MNFDIRKAEAEDRDAIIEVLKHWNMHHIPSSEMPELKIENYFVATVNDIVIGVSGYELLDDNRGKTTLLALHPEFLGHDIGKELQDIRLQAMYENNVTTVTSNCDDLKTINWYKKNYSYRQVGELKKQRPFGRDDTDTWTTLEMDLTEFMKHRDIKNASRDAFIEANDPPPLSSYPPLIINACLTGMVPTRAGTPFVPVSTDEIIEDAIRVYEAGASIVHIHARDRSGKPTSDASRYEKILSGIRKNCKDLICCVSTSGRAGIDLSRRAEVLQLKGDARPDMASLTLGSLNFRSDTSINTIETVEHLAMMMKENNIKAELEVFDTGMINLARYLERHDIISGIKYFNLLLGNLNTAPATLHSISTLTQSLPARSIWSAAGLGVFQLPVNTMAIAAGGHVRVGIEDSTYFDYRKEVPAKNEMLVKRLVQIAETLQRPVASAAETRVMLGLRSRQRS